MKWNGCRIGWMDAMGNEIDLFFVLLVIPSVYLYLMRGLEHVQVFFAHEACFFGQDLQDKQDNVGFADQVD